MTTQRRTAVAVSSLALLGFAVIGGDCGIPLTEQASSTEQACLRSFGPLAGDDLFTQEAVSEVCAALGDTFPPTLEFAGRGCAFRLNCHTDAIENPEMFASDPIRILECLSSVPCSFVRPLSLEALPLAIFLAGGSQCNALLATDGFVSRQVCVEAESGGIQCFVIHLCGELREISCDQTLCSSSGTSTGGTD